MLYAEYRKGNKEGMHNNCVEWVKRNKDNLISSLVIICGILVALLPLRKAFLPGGYYPDLGYHLLRIEGVKDAITAGDFPARIYHLALNGWGYGGSMFYQDYLLFIPALCRLVGFDVITSYKVLIVIATVLISVSTYFSVKYITNSNYPTFSWNKYGLTAYKFTGSSYDYGTFVRMDQYGFYFIDGGAYTLENPYAPESIEDVKSKSKLSLTWDGFAIKTNNGSVSISSNNDIQVLDGSGAERIKLGMLI